MTMACFRNDRRGGLTGKKAIGLIFLVIGVMLMFFIVSQGTTIYRESREGADQKGLSSVRCVSFIYTISDITPAGDELQFEFSNEISSTEDVHNLTVASPGSTWTGSVSIPVGTSQSLRVPVRAASNFTVYPDNCALFPALCSIGGDCTHH